MPLERFTLKEPRREYKLPIELSQFAPAISMCISHRHAVSRHAEKARVNLAVRQNEIAPETWTRERLLGEIHVDDQGGVIDSVYLATNRTPTRFYKQPFYADPSKLNQGAVDVIDFSTAQEKYVTQHPEPFDIVCGSCYSAHRRDMPKEFGLRTFIRLLYYR